MIYKINYSFKKISNLIGSKNILNLSILFIFLFIYAFLEFISLATIPTIISLILDQKVLFSKINISFFKDFLLRYQNSDLIILFTYLIIIVFIIKNISLFGINYFHGRTTRNIKIYISNRVFSNYLKSDYTYFLNENSSVFQRTILLDVGNTSIFFFTIINFIKDFFVLISICILILSFNYYFFILILLMTLLAYILFKITAKTLFKRGYSIQKLTSNIVKYINETKGIIKEIKIYHLENKRLTNFLENISQNEEHGFKNYVIQTTPRLLYEILGIIIISFTILFFLFLEKNLIDLIPLLTLIVVCVLKLIPTINNLTTSVNSIKVTTASFEKINNLINFTTYKEKQKLFLFKKSLELKNVSFYFKKKKILNSFSLKILKNEKIGIIGKSGIGKSTLVNIILGLLPISDGKIIADGKELKKDFIWKKNIGYVPQDVFLLDDSIKNNIILGSYKITAKKKELDKCTKLSQLYEFIMELPDRYDTLISESGANLSIGQKQRLGVARALFTNPKFLILDESTSSLDPNTEKKFVEDIFNACKDITIIFISHKLKTLSMCDKIYDFNKLKFS